MGRLINRSSLSALEPLLTKYYPHLLKSASDNNTGNSNAQDASSIQNLSSSSSSCYSSVQMLLERALIEHNMLAAGLIYNNITLDNLGLLLEISTAEVIYRNTSNICSY
ncbi:unnamed protein product [Trichobilharzia regenti]|nr:unnamed protein product [Trichobilharzia regenti]